MEVSATSLASAVKEKADLSSVTDEEFNLHFANEIVYESVFPMQSGSSN